MHKSEKFWNRVSGYSKPEPIGASLRVVTECKRFLKADDYVLDFGCGPGVLTNLFAADVRAIEAIDISSGMLTTAKE